MAYTKSDKDTFVNVPVKIDGDPRMPTLNFASMNIMQATREIQAMISNPMSSGFIATFSDGSSHSIDKDKQGTVISYLENLSKVSTALVEMQADALLSYEIVGELVKDKRDEFYRKIRLKEDEFIVARIKFEQEGQREKEQTVTIQKENEQIAANTQSIKDRTRVEVQEIETRIESLRIKNQLMAKVVEKIDFDKLPPDLYAYVIASIFTDPSKAFTDFNMNSRLADWSVKEKQQDVRKKKLENDALANNIKEDKLPPDDV